MNTAWYYKLSLVLLLAMAVTQLSAQDFARGTGVSHGMAGHSSYSYGHVFFSHPAGPDINSSEGVEHAQLIRNDMVIEGCQNSDEANPDTLLARTGFFRGYEGKSVFRGDTIPTLPAGHYDSTSVEAQHYSWNSQFGYDSVATLVLDVYPIYEIWDTLRIDSTELPAGWHGGPNDFELSTMEHGCDSILHYMVYLCGGLVYDADGNAYNSKFVGPFCWTLSNSRTERYVITYDSVRNRTYYAPEFPDTVYNFSVYGHLYDWYATVGVPKGSNDKPETTVHGDFVTGICPVGWHIPEEYNMESLTIFPMKELKSTMLWLIPGNNATGFNALPAGYYNAAASRFENMLGDTRFWSLKRVGDEIIPDSRTIYLNCEQLVVPGLHPESYAYSVRCVKNHVYNDLGEELND